MKLTWFGGTTVRVHIGGVILVVDPDGAPAAVDRAELLSGADRVIKAGELRSVDFSNWRPRKVGRLLDETEETSVDAWSNESGAILIEALGEAPLLLIPHSVPPLGRWVEGAIVVLFGGGGQLVDLGRALLDERSPRLLALAGNEAAIDDAVPRLRDHLDGSGLVALEAGMALEV
ncbi:hypothetical protein [Devosia naphthalenivorans]|uniref:hypothetical protein n=1 Tax=Devosia naphthalenivorans TaxID=2082392 RepID=UPI000D3C24F2|nr:hypothetical protein [Devosia naphthalenivorans]